MKTGILSLLLITFLSVGQARGQQFAQPEKEHQWLKQFAGKWESTSEVMMGPDQPPMIVSGSMSARMLGEFWMIGELKAEMMGMEITAINTIGFDSKAKRFIGTWVDSSSDHVWHYKGSLDASGKVLTLEAEGPNFADPEKTTLFRDIYEFKAADHLVLLSQMRDENGEWIQFAKGDLRRR
ncbi:MAG TPA: DUF1579 domain-containing protein [Pirellulaceae bacterium]|nr:DUF1579 domain-containing protein [Pirellulaceae bacterium]